MGTWGKPSAHGATARWPKHTDPSPWGTPKESTKDGGRRAPPFFRIPLGYGSVWLSCLGRLPLGTAHGFPQGRPWGTQLNSRLAQFELQALPWKVLKEPTPPPTSNINSMGFRSLSNSGKSELLYLSFSAPTANKSVLAGYHTWHYACCCKCMVPQIDTNETSTTCGIVRMVPHL